MSKAVLLAMGGLLLLACGGEEPGAPEAPGDQTTAQAASSPTPQPTPTPVPTPTATQHAVTSPIPPAVRLPQDDSPHPWANTEWWYYNGSLRTADGRDYGFHYVIFKIDVPFLPNTNIAHLSITDHQTSDYLTDQRQQLSESPLKDDSGFSFTIDGWTMAGFDGRDHLSASIGDYAFDLSLNSKKPPVLHGGTGLIGFGPAGNSYYYSRTRLAISGILSVKGQEAPATGFAWFDRQWGNFTVVALGWDWFSLRFDDGSELMLYQLKDEDQRTIQYYGTYIARTGQQETLADSDVTVKSTGTWTSPASGAEYPMGWTLKVPSRSIDIALTPVIKEAEFDATSTTGNYYWEGEVKIGGSHTGQGYVELVGYVPPDLPSE
ncbi:MAG: lipocalin family protein [Dehalococcoidia bacterium]